MARGSAKQPGSGAAAVLTPGEVDGYDTCTCPPARSLSIPCGGWARCWSFRHEQGMVYALKVLRAGGTMSIQGCPRSVGAQGRTCVSESEGILHAGTWSWPLVDTGGASGTGMVYSTLEVFLMAPITSCHSACAMCLSWAGGGLRAVEFSQQETQPRASANPHPVTIIVITVEQ